jgi:hypothetical protein
MVSPKGLSVRGILHGQTVHYLIFWKQHKWNRFIPEVREWGDFLIAPHTKATLNHWTWPRHQRLFLSGTISYMPPHLYTRGEKQIQTSKRFVPFEVLQDGQCSEVCTTTVSACWLLCNDFYVQKYTQLTRLLCRSKERSVRLYFTHFTQRGDTEYTATIKQVCQIQNRLRAKSEIQFDNLGCSIPCHIPSSFLIRKFLNLERSQGWKISIKFNFARFRRCIVQKKKIITLSIYAYQNVSRPHRKAVRRPCFIGVP